MKTFKLSRIILLTALTVCMGAANAGLLHQNFDSSLQKDSSQTINSNYRMLMDEPGPDELGGSAVMDDIDL